MVKHSKTNEWSGVWGNLENQKGFLVAVKPALEKVEINLVHLGNTVCMSRLGVHVSSKRDHVGACEKLSGVRGLIDQPLHSYPVYLNKASSDLIKVQCRVEVTNK